jgi:hypothetical protein
MTKDVMLPLHCAEHRHVGFGTSSETPCPWCEIDRLRGELSLASEGLAAYAQEQSVEPTREHPTTDPATAYRTTCNHPPDARGLTGCLLCGAPF